MKIVFLPGVGFHGDHSNVIRFFDKIKKEIDCDIEYFQWKHGYMGGSHDDHHHTPNLPYKNARSFFSEIILDFQHVLRYSDSMELPEADIYMGHSAGSIIAIQQDKPCILFGSPALLIEDLQFANDDLLQRCLCKDRSVLNIVQDKDIIGYPINHDHVEDFIFKGCWFNPLTYSPIAAHGSYWTDKDVLKKITLTLKQWQSI